MQKTGERWTIKDNDQLGFFTEYVKHQWLAGKTPTFCLLKEDRSDRQNAMFYALYSDIAKQKSDSTLIQVKADCKLRYGVVIRKAADPEWARTYDRLIKPMSMEHKLLLMQEYPITSTFTKAQGSDYIDSIIHDYSVMGYALADPRTSGNR